MAAGKDFTERKALAIFDAWQRATDQSDPKWRKLYAEAAIAAGLPFYQTVPLEDDTWAQVNAGPQGWRRWAAQEG